MMSFLMLVELNISGGSASRTQSLSQADMNGVRPPPGKLHTSVTNLYAVLEKQETFEVLVQSH